LEDGTFVSGSNVGVLKQWNDGGTVLQTFSIGRDIFVYQVIELNSKIILSSAGSFGNDNVVHIWQRSSGTSLRALRIHSNSVFGLVKLNGNRFLTGSYDLTMRVWDGRGESVEVIQVQHSIDAMRRVGNVIVTTNMNRLEVRQLK